MRKDIRLTCRFCARSVVTFVDYLGREGGGDGTTPPIALVGSVLCPSEHFSAASDRSAARSSAVRLAVEPQQQPYLL